MKILISMLTILTLAGSLTACSAKTISGETAPAAESSAGESSTESSGSDAAADHSDAALGNWVMRDEDTSSEQVYVSKTEAYSVESFDLTATFSFDENRDFLFKGIPAAKTDYTLKDGVFVFIAKDQIALKMEKTDGSDDEFGEYRILDCEFRKKLQETLANPEQDYDWVNAEEDRLMLKFSENETVLLVSDRIDGFELKPDVIITDIDGDGVKKETPYKVEGDTLTLYPAENEEVILIRKTGS